MTLNERIEPRLPIVMPIYLIDGRRTAQPPELALTENVSSSGVRVISKWKRKPGEQERFTLLSGEDALAAQVVYCQETPQDSYCIGLRLRQPCAGWWHTQAKPPRRSRRPLGRRLARKLHVRPDQRQTVASRLLLRLLPLSVVLRVALKKFAFKRISLLRHRESTSQ